ncbi:MAG TPA: universal stress protein [Acidimicrobiales bacterium]|jgi:nucleotide-binding universal stress UspA family protein|nr:universal stress protein [Acidimicrobiales bacterium]
MSNSSPERIVVGVDGSPEAARALTWAVNEARLRGAGVEVIHVFVVPDSVAGPSDQVLYPALAEEAQEVLTGVLASAPSFDGLDVSHATRHGSPARVLVEESADASLLVIGKRGGGGFGSLTIGSVASQCVHHANCAVVVVG